MKFLTERETEKLKPKLCENNSETSDWLDVDSYRNEWIYEQLHTLDVSVFLLLDRKAKTHTFGTTLMF